jgi:hypothetical protein
LAAGLGLLLLLTGGAAARSEQTLRTGLARVARNIKGLLLDLKINTKVSVGSFRGPNRYTSAGPGIVKLLSEELVKQGVAVTKAASVRVEGRYRPVKVKETGELAVQIFVDVLDGRGKSLMEEEYQFGIFNDVEIAAALGLTAALPLRDRDRIRRLVRADKQPQFYRKGTKGTRIAADRHSPYAVEILVGPTRDGPWYKRRPRLHKKGYALVRIRRHEYYCIRLINGSRYEAAAVVTIDGLNLFAFSRELNSRGQPFSRVILSPGRSSVITGWPTDNELSDAFVVTAYAHSAAAQLTSKARTGTITVAFAAAWPKDGRPPPDEPERPRPRSAGGDGTGRGAQVKAHYREVERNVGVVRAVVSVRYNRP